MPDRLLPVISAQR